MSSHIFIKLCGCVGYVLLLLEFSNVIKLGKMHNIVIFLNIFLTINDNLLFLTIS